MTPPNRFGINRAVLALASARMADGLGNSILVIIIPLYVASLPSRYLDLPVPVLVGILISIYGIIFSFAQPFTGALSDRLGRRKPMIQVGLAIMAAGTLSFMLVDHFVELLALRILQGVAVAISIPASMSILTAITRKETRGAAMGVYSTFRLIGFASGPIIGGAAYVQFGFNAAFLIGAGFVLLAMLLVQIWVRDVPARSDAAAASSRSYRILDRRLLTPGILSATLATFLLANCFSMVTTLENEFNARLGMTALGFGFAYSTLMISRLILQVPLGRLSDIIGRKPVIIAGLLLMVPSTALLGQTTEAWQLVVLRFFQGIAAAGIAAPSFAIAGDLSTDGGEARQMGLVSAGFGFGMALGPLLGGFLSVVFFDLPFIVAGIMSLAGAGVVWHYMPETIDGERAIFRSKTVAAATPSIKPTKPDA